MNWLDILIIFVVFVSTSLSFFRGLFREVFSLLGWFFAAFLASLFHPSLALLLSGVFSSPATRAPLAYGLLFVSTKSLFYFVSVMIKAKMKRSELTHVDRALGTIFGFLRGILLVVVSVGILRWFELFVGERWWDESMLMPYLESLQDWADAITQSIAIGLAS